jgi:predicted enzyme related to lactoylglutathione lyase
MTSGLGYFVIHVPDALRATEFYRAVLGWTYDGGAGTDGYYHVSGSSPAGGIAGGADGPRIDSSFVVEDAVAAVRRVRELGGTAPEPRQSKSGWSVDCTDDQGGRFGLWQPSEAYAVTGPPKCGDGDLFYFVLPTGHAERAKRFYGALFGWEFAPGSHPGGWQITNTEPAGGMFAAGAPAPIEVYYQVADVDAAIAKILTAGGTSDGKEENASGWHARCRDDQGAAFNIGMLRPGYGH